LLSQKELPKIGAGLREIFSFSRGINVKLWNARQTMVSKEGWPDYVDESVGKSQ
jgi:hypothetical protein